MSDHDTEAMGDRRARVAHDSRYLAHYEDEEALTPAQKREALEVAYELVDLADDHLLPDHVRDEAACKLAATAYLEPGGPEDVSTERLAYEIYPEEAIAAAVERHERQVAWRRQRQRDSLTAARRRSVPRSRSRGRAPRSRVVRRRRRVQARGDPPSPSSHREVSAASAHAAPAPPPTHPRGAT